MKDGGFGPSALDVLGVVSGLLKNFGCFCGIGA
jgi:hypothetical protein